MSFHRSKVDLLFTDSGDFQIDSIREDLKDTSEIPYRAFIQQIATRVSSSRGDWRLQPTLGAGLTTHLGKPNTAELGRQVQLAVLNSLTQDAFIKSSEVKVEVFPIAKNQIAILVLVQPTGDREQVRLSFTYDTKDNKVLPRNV